MPKNKTEEIEAIILELLDKEPEVSVRSVAKELEVSKDDDTKRKAIGRALLSLVEQNLIIPKGSGRSRVYIKFDNELDTGQPTEPRKTVTDRSTKENPFKGIELSPESQSLLQYVSQTTTERTPVGYNQEFLRTYEPNKTFYLTPEQREKLLETGRVEAIERPAGTYARNILNRLLIDLSWNSSRLEGNTYSLLETQRLIELGETAAGKEAAEAQMILNHKSAIEYIVDSTEDEQITSHEVCSVHALLSENLLGDPAASGRLRNIIVNIGGSTYVPLENPQLLRECFDLFVDKINRIADPFEQSLFSIIHLSYLQAFEDVNKRTARLVANIPMIKKNLKPLSFTEVDERAYVSAILGVYERNDISLIRDLYIWAYNRSSQRYTAVQQSMGEPNLLKLRYREIIHGIISSIIIERIAGGDVVRKIREMVEESDVPEVDRAAVFSLIETEIVSLHEGNVARFRVRPSEFQAWKALQ